MIEELKSTDIINKVGGRFKLSALMQRRLVELMQGSRPLIEDTEGKTPMEIVVEEIKREKMHGQVLEVDCTKPDVAVQSLRASNRFADRDVQVALYGALVHVVAEDVAALQPAIEEELSAAGLQIRGMELIAPSLEDVFIASARETERSAISNQPSAEESH